MSLMISEKPEVLHALAGRLRVHLPGWSGQGKLSLEMQVRQMKGVQHVQAAPSTSNVLIFFDPTQTNEPTLLQDLQRLDLATIQTQPNPNLPPVFSEKHEHTARARIAVRGLDRDPQMAARVTAHLKSRPGVRTVKANALTGRVLVEFDEHEGDLDDLLAQITQLELPALPGEDRPAFPLDPGPLIQSAMRTLGATLGLGLLSARRLAGFSEPLPGAAVALHVASSIESVQGLPPIRYGLRRSLGRTVADLLLNIPSLVLLTLAGSPLGLAVTGAESLRLLTEVLARRAVWRRHEERISSAPSAQPNAEVCLQAGERTPLAAQVLEGTGTALGRDGLPQPVVPGTPLPPGVRLYGGPFRLRLQYEASFHAFTTQLRPAPVAPSLFERYHRIVGPFSLAYAGISGLLTRSFTRFLTTLLLVNPRTAAIGIDSADLGASDRVLRGGVTVVGTRPDRTLQHPTQLLLDGTRLLSDGLEICEVIPLNGEDETTEMLTQAAGIARAAGSPWGAMFHAPHKRTASQGHFDGKVATATLDGVRFALGPVEDWSAVPETARLPQHGQYVLALTQEQRPRGLFVLRPHLAEGLGLLVQTCQRSHVELAVLASGDQRAAQALAHRAHVALLEHDDAVGVIRAQQHNGALVAFVSDQMGASAAFAACDLAIGLTDDRFRLPARADLLAPDLTAVAMIIEATARHEATSRDSIGYSLVANMLGLLWSLGGMPDIEAATHVAYLTAFAAITDGWWRFRGGKRKAAQLP